MSIFLKQIILFLAFLLLICMIVFGIQTQNIRNQANFRFEKNYKYLMLGHSHAECAYNDSLISDFKNLATSGESYFYTYYKLEKIFEQNDHIETVLIEFTNNQITSEMDTWIWGDKYISKFYPKYGSFFNFDDAALLMRHNLGSLLNNFSVLQKRNFRMALNNNYDFIHQIGGYVYHKENNLETAITLQEKKGEIIKAKNDEDISESNIYYLEKIVALCDGLGKQIVFIRSPQHLKGSIRNNDVKFLQIYAQRFREVPMLDFNDFTIPNNGFRDLQHLNYRGAQIVSKKLESLLENRIIEDCYMKTNKRIIITP